MLGVDCLSGPGENENKIYSEIINIALHHTHSCLHTHTRAHTHMYTVYTCIIKIIHHLTKIVLPTSLPPLNTDISVHLHLIGFQNYNIDGKEQIGSTCHNPTSTFSFFIKSFHTTVISEVY